MKLLFIFLYSFSGFFSGFGEEELIITKETNEKNQILVYAENLSFSPYTVTIDATLTEMTVNKKTPSVSVVLPKSKTLILVISPKPNPKGNKYGYSLKTRSYMGDKDAKHDDSYVYTLPFKSAHRVSQGYNGDVSHEGIKALDFNMPVGTKVYAMRGGVVVGVKEDSNKGCPSDECLKMGNFVTVLQPDNSFAEYYHLKKEGAVVELGDRIKVGDLIGYSGNTGWATGPHLHIEVYLRKKADEKTTVNTYFNVKEKKTLLKKGDFLK